MNTSALQNIVQCRTCRKLLPEDEAVSVESVLEEYLHQGKSIADLIFELSDIMLTVDQQLPQSICGGCVKDLRLACDFRQRCIDSNEAFLSEVASVLEASSSPGVGETPTSSNDPDMLILKMEPSDTELLEVQKEVTEDHEFTAEPTRRSGEKRRKIALSNIAVLCIKFVKERFVCNIDATSGCIYSQKTLDVNNFIRHFRTKHNEKALRIGLVVGVPAVEKVQDDQHCPEPPGSDVRKVPDIVRNLIKKVSANIYRCVIDERSRCPYLQMGHYLHSFVRHFRTAHPKAAASYKLFGADEVIEENPESPPPPAPSPEVPLNSADSALLKKVLASGVRSKHRQVLQQYVKPRFGKYWCTIDPKSRCRYAQTRKGFGGMSLLRNFRFIINLVIAATSFLLLGWKKTKKRNRTKSYWVHPYLAERNQKGRYATDFEDMVKGEHLFKENFHMSKTSFDKLFELIETDLKPKKNTRPRDAIPPKLKLGLVIEYLASGGLQRHLASCYRVSKQHMGVIIEQVCEAICRSLSAYIPEPCQESFLDVANDYNSRWNFPNCIGALDGKHVSIKAPPNAGSLFYNYKGFHSLAMLAICDASYRFTYLDVGAYGSEGDCNILKHSKFGSDVLQDRLRFPENATVNGVKLPFFFVADDAFPLCKRIMKPYGHKNLSEQERIFNYRLSRARRCIENAFGLLCSKWACLKKTLYCSPDKAQKIITACCMLHNFLITQKSTEYCPPGYMDKLDEERGVIEGEWRKKVDTDSLFHSSLRGIVGRNTDYAKHVRNVLKEYVNSKIGELPWQHRAAYVI